jgi:hypothetical protein
MPDSRAGSGRLEVMPKIEKMFAFVVADSARTMKGVVANIYGPLPMVGADLARVETLSCPRRSGSPGRRARRSSSASLRTCGRSRSSGRHGTATSTEHGRRAPRDVLHLVWKTRRLHVDVAARDKQPIGLRDGGRDGPRRLPGALAGMDLRASTGSSRQKQDVKSFDRASGGARQKVWGATVLHPDKPPPFIWAPLNKHLYDVKIDGSTLPPP